MVYYSEFTEPTGGSDGRLGPNTLENRKRLKRTLLAIMIEIIVITTAIAVVLARRKPDVVPIE